MNNLYKAFRKIHKWLGVSLAIFFIFFALSGIVMNHRGFFSKFDVSRSWLPKEYRYSNWNNAAVRGAEQIGNDLLLIYGNIGVWLANNNLDTFANLNHGFPKGIDNRKISDVLKTQSGEIFAATLFGLFRHSTESCKWQKVNLPIDEQRIVALTQIGDSLLVVTRSYILLAYGNENYQRFSSIYLPAPEGAINRVSLFKTIWLIHSGEILGGFGKILVDVVGIATILLSLTGLFYFLSPKVLRRLKRGINFKSRVKRANRWAYKWHLQVGGIIAFFLLIVTATGMFLRPPLLIPIAGKLVKPIKGSKLDSPNFWDDKLRDILYDKDRDVLFLATSDGIYFVPSDFSHSPFKAPLQPPVSVMGINVFWKENDGDFAVGSFSGLYRWDPYRGRITHYLSGSEADQISGLRSPFGNMPIAGGMILPKGQKIFFDYNQGAFSPDEDYSFPYMPKEVITESGMSLWNLALEVHTWRLVKFLIGDFYILIIPIAGILGMAISITGAIMWVMKRRNKNRKQRQNTCL